MVKRFHWLRWLLITALVVPILVSIASIWLLPWALRKYALPLVKQETKHDLVVEKLTFNPFSLRLRADGIKLTDAVGTSLAKVDKLEVDISSDSIWAQYPVFDSIRCTEFEIVVERRTDGSLNWQDLTAKPATHARRSGPVSEAATLPALRIEELALTHGRVRLTDRTIGQPREKIVDNIDIGLTRFATTPGLDNRLSISATEESGGKIQWNGTVLFGPLRSSGLLLIENVNLAGQKDYLPSGLNFDLKRVIVSASIAYTYKADDLQKPIDIRLNELKLAELIIAHLDGSDWLEIPQITITKGDINLAGQQASLESILIQDGHADLKRLQTGVLEVPGMQPTTTARTGRDGAESGTPWNLKLNRFIVDNFAINWTDEAVKPAAQLAFKPITVEVEGYATDAVDPLNIIARVGTPETGFLRIVGDVQLSPILVDAKLSLQNWPVSGFQPYWTSQVAMAIPVGRINSEVDLSLKLPPGNTLVATASGRFSIDGLEAVPVGEEIPLISWNSLAVDAFQFDTARNTLEIGTITWKQPRVTLEIGEDGKLSIAELLPASQKPAVVAKPMDGVATKSGSQALPIHVELKEFVVEEASGRFRDYTIQPHYNLRLEGFSGSVTGISDRPESKATVAMRGVLDGHAAVSLTGTMQPLAIKTYADIKLSLNALDLTGFSPFAGKYVGYPLQKGKLSLNLAYKINNSELDASNQVLIDRMEFGPATNSPDATTLPVKLGVALMQDMDGRIDIKLPITGNLDDPNFRYGSLVWKALGNVLIKAAASPFTLLGGLVSGGRNDDLSVVEFSPGTATLGDEKQKALRDLADALTKRPQLKLELAGSFDAASDALALNQSAFQHALRRQAGLPDDVEFTPAAREQALSALYEKTFHRPAPVVAPVLAGDNAVTPIAVDAPKSAQQVIVTASEASGKTTASNTPRATRRNRQRIEKVQTVAVNSAAIDSGQPKPSFFGRLFGTKKKADVVVAPPAPEPTTPEYDSNAIEKELFPAFAPKPADLIDLTRAREAIVRDFLIKTGSVPADRVFVVAPAAGSKTGHHVVFTLVP